MNINEQFTQEVGTGKRYRFGRNWQRYLSVLNESRIGEAEKTLKSKFSINTFAGKQFLDAGSGSGLFSLAARRLGARVTSFDYDPDSVNCTSALREKFYSDSSDWKILQGSVLDKPFLLSLGKFDYVYSWGVLHHSGNLWQSLDNIAMNVAEKGFLFIAIYNDQGFLSKIPFSS